MDTRFDDRRWLIEAEYWCNLFKNTDVDRYHFFMGRRRYFLRKLLEKQLREFNEKAPRTAQG